ncbi:MAG: right-handed parallel beta-helix repeat-containing protein [Planctomycetota bacterium]|nr:right-handed parallel beta-helix repeat-containing protein [Planctomycetota bacterium]
MISRANRRVHRRSSLARVLSGASDPLRQAHQRVIELLEARVLLATMVVNTIADAGDYDLSDGIVDVDNITPGEQATLRAAIQNANLTTTLDRIEFALPTGATRIWVMSELPTIIAPVTIDGYTQLNAKRATATSAAKLLVELAGDAGYFTVHGCGLFLSNVTGSTITGLVIGGFPFTGIRIEGDGQNVIEGNYIGTDLSGTQAHPNRSSGIWINGSNDNRIGGTDPGQRNVISGNVFSGVIIGSNTGETVETARNVVQGNYIGVDSTGDKAMGNTWRGVRITAMAGANAHDNVIGGTVPGAGNVISGNGWRGVGINGPGAYSNLVQGNLIGTDYTGTVAIPNGTRGDLSTTPEAGPPSGSGSPGGVVIDGSAGNTIGGLSFGAGNVISGNSYQGVALVGDANHNNLVQGNLIGTDITGTQPLGNANQGIFIYAKPGQQVRDNVIGGTDPAARNVVSGNTEQGIMLSGEGVKNNLIQGNFVGTDTSGGNKLGNVLSGIIIVPVDGASDGASNNTIGGTTPGARNIISGNGQAGVAIVGGTTGSTGNRITGNYVGLNAAGTASIGNDNGGITIMDAGGNYIGGSTRADGNVITGNGYAGVYLKNTNPLIPATSANQIWNNWIGLGAGGAAITSLQGYGVNLEGATNTEIRNNVVSNSWLHGVVLMAGASRNVLTSNNIGLDPSGSTALANAGSGVLISDSADNTIGQSNVISGNSEAGIVISGAKSLRNTIVGNYIGVAANGEKPIGNGRDGIAIVSEASQNVIGTAAARNVIACNGGPGVGIKSGTRNTVRYNSIFANKGYAIDLSGDGETANHDPKDDTSTKPNKLLNYPVITQFQPGSAGTHVSGYYRGKVDGNYDLDFYASPTGYQYLGDGTQWLGSIRVTVGRTGFAQFDKTLSANPQNWANQFATAAATDAEGNTSELSHDADLDGLMDSWEVQGIPIEGGGRYPLAGADPFHKDLYVEVDSMLDMEPLPMFADPAWNCDGLPQTATALDAVVKVFYNARVPNPDGVKGIKLHVDVDESGLLRQSWPTLTWTGWPDGYDAFKAVHFGKPEEQGASNKAKRDAKAKAYRYCVFADWFDPDGDRTHSGFAERDHGYAPWDKPTLGSDDFAVTFGAWDVPITNEDQSAAFMHELGHTLGLGHGGDNSTNFKPDYYSLMNYHWEFRPQSSKWGNDHSWAFTKYQNAWRLDYSYGGLHPVDEGDLNEYLGIGGSKSVHVPVGVRLNAANDKMLRLVPMGGPADFDGNGVIGKTVYDLNYWRTGTVKTEQFHDYNDWANLKFGFQDSEMRLPGVHTVTGAPFPAFDPDDVGVSQTELKEFGDLLENTAALPECNDDTAQTRRDTPVVITVLTNDVAHDGALDPSSVYVVTPPNHGEAIAAPDGTIRYTPETGFFGDDSFEYIVRNGAGDFGNSAFVTVAVLGLPPVIAAVASDFSPIPRGYPPKLTAAGVLSAQGTVAVVRFYKETNGQAGLQTDGDLLVGTDADGTDGWSVSATGEAAAESVMYYAQAADTQGNLSNVVSASATVVDRTVLADIPNQTIDELVPFTFTVRAAGRNGTAITYSLNNATAGAAIDPQTGVFSWTPSESQGGGAHYILVEAQDAATPVWIDRKYITITVRKTNSPPVLNAIADQTATEGIAFKLTVRATDTDQPAQTITYSLSANSPAGATIDAKTGQFTFTGPDGPATHQFTVIATDNGSPPMSDQKTFTIQVNNSPPRTDVKFPWATGNFAIAYIDFPLPLKLTPYDPGQDTITSWQIDWGDGMVETIPGNPSVAMHTYTAFGDYSIRTSATDEDGTTPFRSSLTLKVMPRPAAGMPDPFYGDGGYKTNSSRGSSVKVRDVLLQPDGKLLLAGQQNTTSWDFGFGLTRFTDAGSADSSTFGWWYGCQETSIFPENMNSRAQIESIALQGSKIVAAGWAYQNGVSDLRFALTRYNDRGVLDTSFNTTGIVTTDIPGVTGEQAMAVATLSGGKILAAGHGSVGPVAGQGNYAIILSRYNTDGSLDSSFGVGGIVVLDMGTTSWSISSMAVLPGGKILVGGSSGGSFAMLRLNPDASIDPTFGVNGVALADFGVPVDEIRRFTFLSDGRIVAVGSSGASPYMPFGFTGSGVMAMFTPEGALDPSFGTQGTKKLDFGGAGGLYDVAIDAIGRMVVCGWTAPTGQPAAVALARLNTDGSLDSTFGSGGMVVYTVPNQFNRKIHGTFAYGVEIAPDGRILVGAYRDIISSLQFDEYVVLAFLPQTPVATPQIAQISPDPRTTPIPSSSIAFGTPVAGMDLSHLTLTRNGRENLLTSAQTLTSFDLANFTLADLSSLTDLPGAYRLTVNLAGLTDVAGHALSGQISSQWVFTSDPLVDDPGNANDAWLVRSSTDGTHIEVFRNGGSSPVSTFDPTTTGFLEFQSNGGNDTITIDSLHGNPMPAAGLLIGRGIFTLIAPDSLGFALFIDGSASVQLASGVELSSLSLRDSAQLRASPGALLRIGGLAMDAGARFDLDSGSLILTIDAGSDHGMAQTKTVSNLVASAMRGSVNRWDGPGLTSSAAKKDAGGFTSLGVFNNDDGSGHTLLSGFGGQTVGVNSILVKYTWNGDANVDGVVNADDYFLADSGYITQKGGWTNGDFNYDGVMNADDYFLIDSAFIGQAGLLSAGTEVEGALGRAAELPTPVQTQQRKDPPITVLAELFSTMPIL